MIFEKELARRLHLRFSMIWGDKHDCRFTEDSYIQIWIDDWADGLSGIDPEIIKQGIDFCKINLEWPPSIAEFRKICERSLNIPTPRECLALAVRGDFTYPIVKSIYDKVGSWDMKNGKETDLLKRFEACHKEYIADSRMKKLENDECNKPKLVHDSTQGSVNDERKHITRNPSRGTHLRKVEDYLL